MKYAVYGIVYNSLNTVETTIKSIFDPKYDIVIVDNYSRDGTYEKLLELKKEYNLQIFRLKGTRGKGRDYALRHCSSNSRTAYVDFDVKYNNNFHKLMHSSIDKLFTCTDQYTLYVKRDEAIRHGGWRDLNTGEIEDFVLRIGINATVPALIGFNEKSAGVGAARQKRYFRRHEYLIRSIKDNIDWIRGAGLNYRDIPENMRIKSYEALLYYPIASIKGIYRYDKKLTNFALAAITRLKTLVDPKSLGIDDSFTLFHYYPPKRTNINTIVDDRVKEAWKSAYKFSSYNKLLKDDMLIYVKRKSAVKLIPQMGISAVLTYPPKFIRKL